MLFGEDKNKVYNIVKPNLEAFKYLYKVHLEDLGVRSEDGVFTGVRIDTFFFICTKPEHPPHLLFTS